MLLREIFESQKLILIEGVKWSSKMHRLHMDKDMDDDNLYLDTSDNVTGALAANKESPYLYITNRGGSHGYHPVFLTTAPARADANARYETKLSNLKKVFNKARQSVGLNKITTNSFDLVKLKFPDPKLAAYAAQKFVEKTLINPEQATKDLLLYLNGDIEGFRSLYKPHGEITKGNRAEALRTPKNIMKDEWGKIKDNIITRYDQKTFDKIVRPLGSHIRNFIDTHHGDKLKNDVHGDVIRNQMKQLVNSALRKNNLGEFDTIKY